ncbi:XRE family transcriptional regulator [Sulfurimonas sp. ST-25]|uniref:XRE family transcriptional regulator n=1 Tax=Sulfurimonas sp. ST-25 TaxID=3400151 RepID=UPI003A8857B5
MNNPEKWGERLRELREEKEITQQTIAQTVDKDVTQISRYERGGGAQKMPKSFRRELQGLFTPKEIIYIETGERVSNGAVFTMNDTKNNGANYANQINGDAHIGGGTMMAEEDATGMLKTLKKSGTGMVAMDYFGDVYASAGGGAYNEEAAISTPIAFERSFLRSHFGLEQFAGMHIINATGDSMSPTIMSGELLFVNPFENEGSRIHDGAIYVIMCSDVLLVKRVRRNPITKVMRLISDNVDVDDIELGEDDMDSCKVIGRVIGHFEKL